MKRWWPNGIVCQRCGSLNVAFQPKYNRWQCSSRHDLRQFTLKTGTIFEDSPLGLGKWLMALWMIVNCKNGISSYEIARALGVTQKTAWFMGHRIRRALHAGSFAKLAGEVEIDETFIGEKSMNMHTTRRARRIQGTGGKDKTAVLGLLERGGVVRTSVVSDRRKRTLQTEAKKHVEAGSALYSDELQSYGGLEAHYAHHVINHAVRYVDGVVQTNGMENFWSLLKRTLKGTYISVDPFHLFRHLDEQAYRFNERKGTDRDRFSRAVRQVVGKCLTYAEVSGWTPAGA